MSPMDDVAVIGAGIGGLTLALTPAPRRHRLPQSTRRRRRSGRSASASTCCRTRRAELARLGLEAALAPRRRDDEGSDVLQPLRPAHLRRAARPPCRLRACRSSRSTAPTCSRCCSTPRASASGRSASSWAGAAPRVEQDGDGGDASISAIPPASRCRRAARPSRSPATASTRRCASSSSRTKARRAIRASTCGAARRAGSRSCPAPPWSGPAGSRPARWSSTRSATPSTPTAASSSTGSPRSRRPHHRRRDWNRPGNLDDFLPRLRRLAFRLARRAGAASRRRHGARVSDGRSGPAAALELRPRHAARRRRPSDGAARLERRRPGDPRCALRSPSALAAADDPVAALEAYEDRAPRGDGARSCSRTGRSRRTRSCARSSSRTGDRPFAPHRGRHQPRRARGDVGGLQAGRRL